MNTFMLTAEYDGTRYAGWTSVKKRKSETTVSEKISNAIQTLTGESPELFCASKTDAGVHAYKQVISFQTDSKIQPNELFEQLNCRLPQDIAILSAQKMPERFHAALNAKKRTWLLRIHTGSVPDVFRQKYTYFLQEFPDAKRMEEAFVLLSGRHDFCNFTPVKKKKATEKELFSLDIVQQNDEMHLLLCGNDFLPHMPGTLMQLLVDIGIGAMDASCIPAIFAGELTYKNCYSPYGLYLADVEYDDARVKRSCVSCAHEKA